MRSILVHAIAGILYGVLAIHFWRTRLRPATRADVQLSTWERGVILAPLALHAWLLYDGIFMQSELRFGFSQALSVMLWLAVLIYWIENWSVRLDSMLATILASAAVCVVLPAIFTGFSGRPHANTIGFRVHLILAMAAYSLFTLAALQALFMAVVEKRLHAGARAGPFVALPPLLTLERVLFRFIGVGFILLTATLITGFVFAEQVFGRAFRFDHKTVFAIASWVIFAALLFGRWRFGWRGRIAIRWILSGFAALLLAYVGTQFVLEVVLQRAR